MLDKSSFVPLYHQLQELLKTKILSGEWEPETCIPSLRELCDMYGISTTTAKLAINELIRDGYLYAVQGKGTFVAVRHWPMGKNHLHHRRAPPGIPGSRPGHSFRAEVLSIDVVKASALVSARPSTMARKCSGSDVSRGLPKLRCLIETTFMATDTAPGIENCDLSRSLFRILRDQYHILLQKSDETFRPVFLGELEAELLDQSVGSLAMLNERVSYAKTSRPVLYAKSLIRGDMCKTYFDLTNMRKVKEMVCSEHSF